MLSRIALRGPWAIARLLAVSTGVSIGARWRGSRLRRPRPACRRDRGTRNPPAGHSVRAPDAPRAQPGPLHPHNQKVLPGDFERRGWVQRMNPLALGSARGRHAGGRR
jgi:hypothetical protein